MLYVNCYNCKSYDCVPYVSENGFELVKCSQCGLLYVNPRPTNDEIAQAHHLGVHYGEEVLDVTGSFDNSRIPVYQETLGDLYKDGSFLHGKTWLDIGCGQGEFLVALKRFSQGHVMVKGLEPNIHKCESAQKKGLDVSYFDLDDHTIKNEMISFLNVYSHLPDPPEAIQAWRRLLKPGGELLLQTGDIANFESKDQIKPLILPDHLSFASEGIVVGILERAGFEIVGVWKYPYIRANMTSIAKEIVKIFWPKKKSRLKYLMSNLYANVDMYVRARMKSEEPQ